MLTVVVAGWGPFDRKPESDAETQVAHVERPGDEREHAPRRPETGPRGAQAAATHERLDELEALHAKIERLEAANQILSERSVNPEPERAYDFSQTELEALARNCDVRVDHPDPLTDASAEAMGLREDEREAYEHGFAEYERQVEARRRELALEIGLSAEEYEALDSFGRFRFVAEALEQDADTEREVRRNVAEERAGLREAPSPAALLEQGPYARFRRLALAGGDQFAAELAKELGNERVHELRAAGAGWTGGTARFSGCE